MTPQCGCQCLLCTNDSSGTVYTGPGVVQGANDGLLTSGYCPSFYGYSCHKFNNTQCGPQFSDPAQSSYCAVLVPSSWPAIMQTPSNDSRAGRFTLTPVNQQTPLQLPTSALTSTTATSLSQYLTRLLDLTKISALQNISYTLANGNSVVNGYKLSQIGLQFGTTASTQGSIYLENAFQTVSCGEINQKGKS